MAQLLVRDVEDYVADGLRQLAVAHRRSAEAEHREVLRSYVQENLGPAKRTFVDVLAAMPYFEDDPNDLFEV